MSFGNPTKFDIVDGIVSLDYCTLMSVGATIIILN